MQAPSAKRARTDEGAAEEAPGSGRQGVVQLSSAGCSAWFGSLNALWQQRKLCDLDILVEDRKFHAHRVILAASSPCLDAMLTGKFSEGSADSITLEDLSADSFACVLDFLYTRSCTVPSSLLQSILEAACRLQIADLQKATEQAVIERLSPGSCVSSWQLAEALSLTSLMAAAKKIALEAFEEVAATASPTFGSLGASKLEELLADDSLHVATEEATFNALERWVVAQPSPPTDATISSLLSRVRFAHIRSKEFRRDVVEASPLMQRHSMVLASAYREHIDKEDTPRNRRRTSQTRLTFADLKPGLRVQVVNDEELVKAACSTIQPGAEKAPGALWPDEKGLALGKEFEIKAVTQESMSAQLHTGGRYGIKAANDFTFPPCTLLWVCD